MPYFGTHLADKTPTAVLEALEEAWTKKPALHRAPQMKALSAPWENKQVKPGAPLAISVSLEHADGLQGTWWLATDRSGSNKSGDTSEHGPPFYAGSSAGDGGWRTSQARRQFT